MSKIKAKLKLKGGKIIGKMMFKHPEMTYDQAAKKLGDREKSNFIFHITVDVAGKTVFEASTSQFLSKNPIVKFKAKGDAFKKGDKVVVTYTQRLGSPVTKKTKLK